MTSFMLRKEMNVLADRLDAAFRDAVLELYAAQKKFGEDDPTVKELDRAAEVLCTANGKVLNALEVLDAVELAAELAPNDADETDDEILAEPETLDDENAD